MSSQGYVLDLNEYENMSVHVYPSANLIKILAGLCCRLLTFFKINFQEYYYQSVKPFLIHNSSVGPDLDPNIGRTQKLPL